MLRDLESRLPDGLVEPLTRSALFATTCTGIRRIPVSLLEGHPRGGERPATMLLAGHDPWIRYLPDRFFRETPARRPLGTVPVWRLAKVIETHGAAADLTVIRIDPWSARLWVRDPAFIAVPEWIGTRLHVPADLDPLLRGGGSIKRDMTLVRRHGFETSYDDGSEALHYFYERVYRPYAHSRYGDESYVRTELDLQRRLQRGGMIWALDQDKRVAGTLYERKGDKLTLLALGTLDGDFTLVRQGAVAALYYFALQLAQKLGCTTIDLRGCRPSLSDGVLAYKQKWGAVICEKPETYYDLMVRWNRPSVIVRDFFARSPLVFRDGAEFSALTGADPTPARSPRIEGIRSIYRLTENGRIPLTDA